MPVSTPVSHGTVKVALSDVLEVRSGPLTDEELWAVLCQSAKALQDIFLRGEAVDNDSPRFVLCPYTLHFTPSGRVTFAETINPSLPDIRDFLSPEVLGGHLNLTDVAVEKMLVYSLGMTLLWSSEYGTPPTSRPLLSSDLHSILLAMSNSNTESRVALLYILEVCALHARQAVSSGPYSHYVMQLSKIVMGSVYELDQVVDPYSPGVDADLNSHSTNGVRSPRDAFFALPYLSCQDVRPFYQNFLPPYHFQDFRPCSCGSAWRLSPSKRQQLHPNTNNNATLSRHPRSPQEARSHHPTSGRHHRSRDSTRERLYQHPSNISTSTVDSRNDASPYRSEVTGRSYHLSDIFSPDSKDNSIEDTPDGSTRVSPDAHPPSRGRSRDSTLDRTRRSSSGTRLSRDHSRGRSQDHSPDRSRRGSPETRPPRGRSLERPPPSGDRRRPSEAVRFVYDRLQERRDRLRLLREQLGITHQQQVGLGRPLLGYRSDEDGSLSDLGSESSQRIRARSMKSLTSMESAQEGSYYPDQHRYDSTDSLDLGRPENHLGLVSLSPADPNVPLPPPPPPKSKPPSPRRVDGPPPGLPQQQQAEAGRVPVNGQQAVRPPRTRSKDPPMKKLKKFFGPEFVVMNSAANDSLDMSPSILCKSGQVPPSRKKVTVVLLNSRRLDLMCDLGIKGQEIFDLVSSHIGLAEKVYFGLAYIKDGEYFFLDAEVKLYKAGPKSWKDEVKKKSKKEVVTNDRFTLFFRVKFYLANTSLLKDQLTRHQYYLQLRRDILEERTRCDQQDALRLASLALQAEMGDYSAEAMGRNYFLPEHYIPSKLIDVMGVARIRQTLPPMHSNHKAMAEQKAEMEFLVEARKLQEYGIHFHRASHSKKDPSASIWLGICTRGVIIYEKRGSVRQQVHAHPWHLTKKIAFNRKKFIIEANDGSSNKYIHYTEYYKKGQYMLQLCKSQHKFQMAMRLKANMSHRFKQDFPMEAESMTDPLHHSSYNDYQGEFDFSDDEGSIQESVPESLFRDEDEKYAPSPDGEPDAGQLASHYERIRSASRSSSPQRQPPGYPSHLVGNQRQSSPRRDASPNRRLAELEAPRMRAHDYHSKETLPYDESLSARATPRQTSPERTTPNRTSPNRTSPKRTSPNRTAPNRTAPNRTAPNLTAPNRTTPNRTAPNRTTPNRTAPNRTAPNRTAPNRTAPNRTPSNQERPSSGSRSSRLKRQNQHLSFRSGSSVSGDEAGRPSARPSVQVRSSDHLSGTFRDDGHIYDTVADSVYSQSEQEFSVDDDMEDGRAILGLDNVDAPYVIDASIRTHERTGQLTPGNDGTDTFISETLQERLNDLTAPEPLERDIVVISLKKHPQHDLGMTIVGGENCRDLDLGIFVQSVLPGGPADIDGRLRPGDRIISINGRSLEGTRHHVTLALLEESTPDVQLIVSRPKSTSPDAIKLARLVSEDMILPSHTNRSQPPPQGGEDATPKSQKRKHTPPRKPQRRPESVQGSNHSLALSDASDSVGIVPKDVPSRTNFLTVQKRSPTKPPNRLSPSDDDDVARQRQDQTSNQSEDIHFTSEDEDNVPTPESSDLENLLRDVVNDAAAVPLVSTLATPGFARSDDLASSPDAFDGLAAEQTVTHGMTKRGEDGGGREVEGQEGEDQESEDQELGGQPELKVGDVYTVTLNKIHNSLGISVTGGVNTSVKHGGIYIKSMMSGGAAERNGSIKIGDRVLKVNDDSLEGVTHRQAVETLRRTPQQSLLHIERGIPPRPTHLPPTPTPSPSVHLDGDEEPITSSVQDTVQAATSPSSYLETGDHPSSTVTNSDYELYLTTSLTPTSDAPSLSRSDSPVNDDASASGEAVFQSPDATVVPPQMTFDLVPNGGSEGAPPVTFHGPHISSSPAPNSTPDDDDEWIKSTSSRGSTVRRAPFDPYCSSDDGYLQLPADGMELTASPHSTSDVDSSRSESPLPSDDDHTTMDGEFYSEVGSPVLSTREADNMTPMTFLDWRPASERHGSRSTSTSQQRLSVDDHYSDGVRTDHTDRSLTPSPDPQPPSPRGDQTSYIAHNGAGSLPSPVANDARRQNLLLGIGDTSLAYRRDTSDYSTPSPVPFQDDSASFSSGYSHGSTTPELPPLVIPGSDGGTDSLRPPNNETSSLGSLGALSLTQTMLSTMGFGSDIELPDLPYVTPENTFEVELLKGPHGLGFSIQGGRGVHKDPGMCLVRVKKIFPGQNAEACGLVEEGDVILTVNEHPVYDMTHNDAVAVLRGAPHDVRLLLCRPSDEELDLLTLQNAEKEFERVLSAPSSPRVTQECQTEDQSPSAVTRPEVPIPSTTDQFFPSASSLPSVPESKPGSNGSSEVSVGSPPMVSKTTSPTDHMGEEYLEVTLVKPASGSLGFTVAGGANSGGCYVKDILQDPAKSDGRLRKGDKLIKVNDTDMLSMNHYDAVAFLRLTPREVTILVLRARDRSGHTPLPRTTSPLPPPLPTASPPVTPPPGPAKPLVSALPPVRLRRNIAGHLGLSLTLGNHGDGASRVVVVSEVIPGLPASDDGTIRPGDSIHSINGRSVAGMGLMQARRLLETAPNTIDLKVTRNGQPVQQRRKLPTPGVTPDIPNDDWTPSPGQVDSPKKLSLEDEMKDLLDSLDFGGSSSKKEVEESDWEDFSESEKEHLDEVDAILASLDSHHGSISLRNDVQDDIRPTQNATPKVEDEPIRLASLTKPLPDPSPARTPPLTPPLTPSSPLSSPPTPPPLVAPFSHSSGDRSPSTTAHFSTAHPSTGDLSTGDSSTGHFAPIVAKTEPPVYKQVSSLAAKPSSHSPSSNVGTSEAGGNEKAVILPINKESDPREQPAKSDERVIWVELEKPANGSLGFSLTGGMKGGKTSIFIKTVMPGGIAELDGRIRVGDRLLQVNGESLVGMTQTKAVGLLRKSRGVVKLAITRQALKSTLAATAPPNVPETQRQTPVATDSPVAMESPAVVESPVLRIVFPNQSDDDEDDIDQSQEAQSYTESARDAELDAEVEDLSDFDISSSLNFDSRSLPIRGLSSMAITPPPPGFRAGYISGHDTDDDMNSSMDLPDDSAADRKGKVPPSKGQRKNKVKGQMTPESENSSSWGSDTDIPVSMDHGHTPALRATPGHQILSVVSDAELRRVALIRTAPGGRYSGRALRVAIASLQKQIDKQDPAEEFKILRNAQATDNSEEAKKPNNKDKNRYRNVLPYDKTRVVIQNAQNTNYINASHIRMNVGKDTYNYIACQGPLPQTTGDFWQMVWEQRSDVIAMVTLAVESGKVKCDQYWPDSMETPITVAGRYQLRLDSMQTLDHFDIRKISMSDTKTNAIHYVTHLNFTTWTDHGVPASPLPLLRYIRYMRKIHGNGPIVVHCSAGIGRTGTLLAIDTTMGLIERDAAFRIVDIVGELRTQRHGMIQTKDQYLFCYKAAIELLKSLL